MGNRAKGNESRQNTDINKEEGMSQAGSTVTSPLSDTLC